MFWFKIIIAIAIAVVIWRIGMFFLRSLAAPPPPPPPEGEMRRVKITYRCPSCGLEIRTTKAASADPEPPRHCMDDMEIVPVDDQL